VHNRPVTLRAFFRDLDGRTVDVPRQDLHFAVVCPGGTEVKPSVALLSPGDFELKFDVKRGGEYSIKVLLNDIALLPQPHKATYTCVPKPLPIQLSKDKLTNLARFRFSFLKKVVFPLIQRVSR